MSRNRRANPKRGPTDRQHRVAAGVGSTRELGVEGATSGLFRRLGGGVILALAIDWSELAPTARNTDRGHEDAADDDGIDHEPHVAVLYDLGRALANRPARTPSQSWYALNSAIDHQLELEPVCTTLM